jgi:small-conductance mechanosensitive channel
MAFFYLWEAYFTNVVTVISFMTAAITLALREFIINLFSGFYIKMGKPFKIEDRIEINDVTGDVVNINMLSFDILEVNDKDQSTGIITTLPNSSIFNYKLKNYMKGFKYIWDEITIKLDLQNDLDTTEELLYKIVNQNDVIKQIPSKMMKEMQNAVKDYRVYYNHLNPIIYVSIVDYHYELTIRFLVHPKKKRYVDSAIYRQILKECQRKKIILYNINL